MWDWQKNILVFDLPEPSDYRELPVLGMRTSLLSSWKAIPWAVVLALTLFLFLYLLNKLYLVRALLVLIPVGLLIWSGPPSLGPFSPYRDDAGIEPYQTLIDRVNELDGLSMWSQVETVDDHHYMGVGIHTSKHPEVLVESMNYRSHGIIYPDVPTAHEPGAQWDQALLAYLTGERTTAPWGWGELAYHYPIQSSVKGLRDALTVVLAPDRSPRSIYDALKSGKGYAVRAASRDGRLKLDRFEAVSGDLRAGMGQELGAHGPVSVELSLSFTGSEELPVTVRVIRSGEVIAESDGVPPLTLSFNDPSPDPGEAGAYYRLWIEGPDITHRLLSNPIFIRYTGEADGVPDR